MMIRYYDDDTTTTTTTNTTTNDDDDTTNTNDDDTTTTTLHCTALHYILVLSDRAVEMALPVGVRIMVDTFSV